MVLPNAAAVRQGCMWLCALRMLSCHVRALQKKNGKITRGKNCLSKCYVRTRGQRMWKSRPRGCCGTPRDLPCPCPRKKTFKRLATCDTLHGWRPNLRQRDPNGSIVPTPYDVSDKGASKKRCARTPPPDNYTYTYIQNIPPKHPQNIYWYIIGSLGWHRRRKTLYAYWGWRWLATTL